MTNRTKNPTTFRDARSLLAGVLIGVSVVIGAFAMTVADLGDRQTVWVIAAPIVLVLGFMLQGVVSGAAVAGAGTIQSAQPRVS